MAALTVLGIDPGSKNMGFGVVKARIGDKFDFRIKEVGMFQDRVEVMNGDVRGALKKFNKELGSILRKHNVDVIVAERYMNRGIRGNTGELVGLMLGAVAMANGVEDVMFIPAAQWKNPMNKNTKPMGGLEQLYKDCRLVPHVVDGASIGMYGATHYLDHKPFEFLSSRKGRAKYLSALNTADVR